ncbi:16S rRNA (uracil(1498)-N(3))-methyltransferase [Marinomonas mediterranea]|uniref:16S rRNA (uracil(1498)-N(3))-methyltransferase n=1 Tax=Marinomonas mediterranea TaxID=119864 RepID=UPI00234989DA|nr:16S rRNA (uracil(1498)-N(3))-methyltransferase [Marinomonas mediterranea]WCN08043.1 16S rRNA (uracil(1498)-N(3))-methyltransferase [Marinomonas mediterranea]
MNLILLQPEQQQTSDCFKLTDAQLKHISQVLQKNSGDRVRVGLLNGDIGEAVFDASGFVNIDRSESLPPAALPLTLVLALPRPNMLKRTLMNVTAMGVKRIYLIHSSKVEKSYWQSPVLKRENINAILLEGLEQARDTVMPELTFCPRFKPFVEDVLPSLLSKDVLGLIAHPYDARACPIDLGDASSILAIGPEGGWSEYEVGKWQEAGMETVHLGERILRVETAVPVLLSRLYPA